MENREENVSNRKRNCCTILKEKPLSFIKWVLVFSCDVYFLALLLACSLAAGARVACRPKYTHMGKGRFQSDDLCASPSLLLPVRAIIFEDI